MMAELWLRKTEMRMKMITMWRIRADMRNHRYHLPDWVGTTLYQGYYTPDWDWYLWYRVRSIDLHTEFS
jgi:hypothetical protein